MTRKKLWTRASKWGKYLVLSREPSLKPYMPETHLFNKKKLIEYVNKYPMVILKPVFGTGGGGIIKITLDGNQFLLQSNIRKKTVTNVNTLYNTITQIINRKSYMIQQGIQMIAIDDRPIDFRILMLKPHDKWGLMGIMGRLAAKNKIVTNHSRGGKPIRFPAAMRKSMNFTDQQIAQINNKLSSLGYKVANTLSQQYVYVREIGLDIAIDSDQKIWILETNSMPRFHLFKFHRDRALYAKIYRYVKHIRRNY